MKLYSVGKVVFNLSHNLLYHDRTEHAESTSILSKRNWIEGY